MSQSTSTALPAPGQVFLATRDAGASLAERCAQVDREVIDGEVMSAVDEIGSALQCDRPIDGRRMDRQHHIMTDKPVRAAVGQHEGGIGLRVSGHTGGLDRVVL